MPKQTFVNLSESKKAAIDLILIDLYSQFPASLVTVSDVIKKSTFSRAAFYKYFEDIEDAHQYIVRVGTDHVHHDIMTYINQEPNNIFGGIEKYLLSISHLDPKSTEYKMLSMLIKNGSVQIPKSTEHLNAAMVDPWISILKDNHIKISNAQESIAFLYFIMDLTMDSIGYYVLGSQNKDEMIKNYQYKVQWVEKGIK